MSASQQEPQAIVENGALLRTPGAMALFGRQLDGMTAEEAVHWAVHLETVRLQEAGIEENAAYGAELLRLAVEGPGLVPAWLCGTTENNVAVARALEETRQMLAGGQRHRRRRG